MSYIWLLLLVTNDVYVESSYSVSNTSTNIAKKSSISLETSTAKGFIITQATTTPDPLIARTRANAHTSEVGEMYSGKEILLKLIIPKTSYRYSVELCSELDCSVNKALILWVQFDPNFVFCESDIAGEVGTKATLCDIRKERRAFFRRETKFVLKFVIISNQHVEVWVNSIHVCNFPKVVRTDLMKYIIVRKKREVIVTAVFASTLATWDTEA
ncbi:uncharacterized protein LOC131929331 [Physella acuta]|uniref:uncharacterized protein LOC131929331 n=1 Tax=Physella acuta TaxID=109671 RepID=UPI0027DCD8D3|nr:uncharacterized protein LOC131929331 [Physella acuta]